MQNCADEVWHEIAGDLLGREAAYKVSQLTLLHDFHGPNALHAERFPIGQRARTRHAGEHRGKSERMGTQLTQCPNAECRSGSRLRSRRGTSRLNGGSRAGRPPLHRYVLGSASTRTAISKSDEDPDRSGQYSPALAGPPADNDLVARSFAFSWALISEGRVDDVSAVDIVRVVGNLNRYLREPSVLEFRCVRTCTAKPVVDAASHENGGRGGSSEVTFFER